MNCVGLLWSVNLNYICIRFGVLWIVNYVKFS